MEAINGIEEIRLSEAALELAGVPIIMWRVNGIIYANRKTVSLTGYSRRELLKMTMFDLISPRYKQTYKRSCEILFGTIPGTSRMLEITIVNREGMPIRLELSETKIRMGNGTAVYLAVLIDMSYTKRKIRENAILLDQISKEVNELAGLVEA